MKKQCAFFSAICLATLLAAQAPQPPALPAPPRPPRPPELFADTAPSRVETHRAPLAMGKKLWVKTRYGNIQVQGWDREEVLLEAQIWDTPERKISIDLVPSEEGLTIKTITPDQSKWFFSIFGWKQKFGSSLHLKVPRKLAMALYSTHGQITVNHLDGYARCETTHGDVRLTDLQGEAYIRTTHGDLLANQLKARLDARTTHGDAVLENVLGGIKLQTTHGSVQAKGLDGWGEGIFIQSTMGDMEIDLGGTSGTLEAKASRVDFRHPKAQILEECEESIRATIPGSGQSIKLRTTHGEIKIR